MKTKIVIVGIGGVGGYFGGLLSRKYAASQHVEIVFVARGAHLKEIKENGLTVIGKNETFITRPDLATADFNEIGLASYIIICTKSYDLGQTIEQLKDSIDQNTVILPLLNGVNAVDTIHSILPDPLVLSGCAYIVSRLNSPGVIENKGNIQKLSFGLDAPLPQQVLLLKDIFTDAGIDVLCSDRISPTIWEKFIFISATATATSYFDISVGRVMDQHLDTVLELIREVTNVAVAKGITVADNITEKTLDLMRLMAYDATSSMHSDYIAKKPETEVESLTGYVIREADKLGLKTPVYQKLYEKLKA